MGDINYNLLVDDMTFSYSRINTYHSCPYGWKLNYIDELKPTGKFYSSYGKLIHQILERYFDGSITKSEMPIEFLTKFEDLQGVRPSAKIVECYIRDGLEYLRGFEDFDLNKVAIEEKVEFDIKGIPMIGIIDFIGERDGEYIIVDHKSHRLKQRSKGVKQRKSDVELDEYLRQLYLYSTAIYDKFGKFPTELWFNCFRNGEIIKEQFNKEKYDESVRWVVETVDAIKADTDFEPNYDYFYCRWICGQSSNCEIFLDEVMNV